MLIGVVGFIGSGKGTVGDILHRDHGYYRDSFAKPLKDAVSIIFGWDREMLEGVTDESREWREQVDPYWSEVIERVVSPRSVLQQFGTECIRNVFHSNVWSASLIKRYEDNNFEDTVVTDCRFGNEIDAIQKAGGYIIRVKRGDDPEWLDDYLQLVENQDWFNINKLREDGYFPHVSETDWIGLKADFNIKNDGTVRELENRIESIILTLEVSENL